ncbi:MAG: glycosyltransferase family 39 protein [Anaerolineae bacterium]
MTFVVGFGTLQKMSRSLGRSGPLILLLLAHFAVCVAYSTVVPLAEAPDELSHYDFFRFVAQERTLPASTSVDEAIQPPLYYLLAASLTAGIPMDLGFARSNPDFRLVDPAAPKNLFVHGRAEAFPYRGGPLAMHVARWLSALLSTIAVWAMYRVALVLARGDRGVALGAAAFLAFVPEFCFLGGAVHNDNLVAALSGLLLWRLLVILEGEDAPIHWVGVGCLLGLALLSKLSLLGFLVPLVGVAGYRAWYRYRQDRAWWESLGPQASGLGLALTVALVLSGWWFLRNTRLYGDPLGWGLLTQGVDLRTCPLGWGDLGWLFWGLFESFWGRFGGAAHIRLPLWLYALFAIGTGISVAGALKTAWRLGFGGRGREAGFRCWFLMAGWAVLVLLSLLVYTVRALGTNQARLLYPALLPLIAILWFGALQLVPKRRHQRFLWACPMSLWICNVGILFLFLRPIYAPPPPPSPAELSEVSEWMMEDFGGRVRLLAYRLEPKTLLPGHTAELRLYWQALEDLHEDYRVSLWVEGPPSVPPWEIKRAPAAGLSPTDLWKSGKVTADRYGLTLPPNAPLGEYRLRVGLRSFGSGEWAMPASSIAAGGSDPRVDVTSFSYAPAVFEELPAQVQHHLRVELGQEVALVGYEVREVFHPTRPEVEGVRVVLYWEALGLSRRDLTFFVHLLDQDGQFVAGHDGVPYGGLYVTSTWPPGAVVVDVHHVSLEHACPGRLLIPQVGAYPSPVGPRLTISGGGDGLVGEDRILLEPLSLPPPPF